MKKTVIIGNIGQDAQLRTTQNGKQLASFTVAVSEKIGQQEQTTWFNCAGWGERFTGTLLQYLRKGTKVYIEGNYSPRMYQRTDGSMDISHDIMVNHIELLGGQQQQAAQPQQPVQQPIQQPVQQPIQQPVQQQQPQQQPVHRAAYLPPQNQPQTANVFTTPGSGHKDDMFANDPPF